MVEIAAAYHSCPLPIYKRMRNYKGWWGNIEQKYETIIGSNEISSKYKQFEFELDKKVIRAREFTKQLLELLCERGKEIIITSDMYLSASQISELLYHNGIFGFKKIYVSKNGYSKSKGNIFDQILKEYPQYSPANFVHIGDNKQSDYDNPIKHGWKAILLEKPLNLFKQSRIGERYIPTSNGDRILIGLIANKYFDNPFYNFDSKSFETIGYALGAFFTSHALSVNEDALRSGVDKLLLVMSDGYLLTKLLTLFSRYIPTVEWEEFYLSRLSRAPKIIKYQGITGDMKQLKYYMSIDFFVEEKRKDCSKILANAKNLNTINIENTEKLLSALDWDYIDKECKELDKYIEHICKGKKTIALFDGSYNATAYDFMSCYYPSIPVVKEYQLIGSPKNAPVYNYIQTKSFIAGKHVLDTDPCIKTSERKVDNVHIEKNGNLLKKDHGYERPNICAALIQNRTIEFAKQLMNQFGEFAKVLTFNSYTFWNPIIYLWEMNTASDCELVKAFEDKRILSTDVLYAKSCFAKNELSDNLSEYYLAQIYLKESPEFAIELCKNVAAKGVLVAQKMFIDEVLVNNISEYYPLVLKYIKNLQAIDPQYYGRMARLYRIGKGVDKDLDVAIKNYRIAADNGVEWAMNELFDVLCDLKNPEYYNEMVLLVEARSKQGDPGAMKRWELLKNLINNQEQSRKMILTKIWYFHALPLFEH